MAEIDIMELIKSPETQKDVLGFLGAIEKHEKSLDTILKIIDKLNNIGVIPAIVRSLQVKWGIDLEKPLESSRAIVPKTDTHKIFFEQLNSLSENEIKNIAVFLQEIAKKQKEVGIKKNADTNSKNKDK